MATVQPVQYFHPGWCARPFSCPGIKVWSGNETTTALLQCISIFSEWKTSVYLNCRICLLQRNTQCRHECTKIVHCRNIVIASLAKARLCIHSSDILHHVEYVITVVSVCCLISNTTICHISNCTQYMHTQYTLYSHVYTYRIFKTRS